VINKILCGDAIALIKDVPDEHVNCVVTSPPYYGLRDYGHDGQIGLEKSPKEYVEKLVELFREIHRILKKDGTVWLNLGDSYNGSGGPGSQWDNKNTKGIKSGNFKKFNNPNKSVGNLKPKDLIGIPWRVAFALQADGWYLRQDIIWHKPNPMPESVKDRCTKAHEYIFLLSKSAKYYYDAEAIMEDATGFDGRKDTYFKGGVKYDGFNEQTMLSRGHERWRYKNLKEKGQQTHTMHEKRANGLQDELSPIRNKRSVWTVTTKPYKEAHFATYPQDLIKPCILAGCPENGIVFDPFMGSGTTAVVARKLNRNYLGIELNPEYVKLSEERIYNELGMFN